MTSCATRQVTVADRGPVYTGSSQPGLIPAGTTVEVRTNEPIEATSADAGKTFSAVIARDIVDADGKVLVPRGSPAELAVLRVNEGGTLTSDQVELGLRSITVNGRTLTVNTETTTSGDSGLGANRRTATMVGGGALLGTLIGAIAGGGKGAAIGAATGAAAGAAAQVLTKGKEVKVPAESVLTFRLEQPIRLQS
jgi:hypothetical protein